MSRRTALLVAAGVVVLVALGAGAKLINVRAVLGIEETASGGPCPDPEDVLLPRGIPSPAGRWRLLPPLPVPHDELRAATVGSLIYIGSGLEERRPGAPLTSTDIFIVFDPQQSTYRRLPPLPRRVDHPALVGVRGGLYLIGGYHDGQPISEAFRYSPRTGEWTKLAPLPTARGAPTAAAIGGQIYVVGGSTVYHTNASANVSATDTVEIYDVATGRWSRGPDMPTARHHAGAAVVGGRLYVVGGRRPGALSLEVAERFDPRTNRWEKLPSLPLGAGGLAVVAAGNRVVALGGGDDGEDWVTPATWSFDPDSNRWQRLADLRLSRHGHAAAALGPDAYAFGGSPCPGYALHRHG